MKPFHLLLIVFLFPFTAEAQTSIGGKRIIDGHICDKCDVPIIYNSEKPLSYILLGASEAPGNGKEVEPNGVGLPFVSKYAIVSGEFSFDFMFKDIGELESGKRRESGKNDSELQFQILHNDEITQNWSHIYTLPKDTNFTPYISVQEPIYKTFFPETYHAGKFKMNVNDSIIVRIRNARSKMIVQSIFLKRSFTVPTYSDYRIFSSDIDLQEILNNGIGKEFTVKRVHEKSLQSLQMESNDIAVFKFSINTEPYSDIEYTFAEDQTAWKTLSAQDLFQRYAYIIINKPPPGKTIELSLRYEKQPESIYQIKIKVRENLASTTWFKVTLGVSTSILLFAGWYTLKRRAHLKQVRRLTNKKEELESKLQLLSGQLNPHFLFNSLNSVQNLINNHDNENANLYVSEVSSFLRTIMDAGKKEYISLKEELNLEESYINLERKRKAFTYQMNNNCRRDLNEIEFPPLLLQPIIENCLHHGFSSNIQHPSIVVTVNCIKEELLISVEDNGQGFNVKSIETGHGISLVQKRISLFNEKLRNMTISMNVESTDRGTVTTFSFQNWL